MIQQANLLFFYRTAHPFSNFHPSKFEVDGLLFHWAEQYIMYRKALQFEDHDAIQKILAAKTPAECKQLGREVKGFKESEWVKVREQIAVDAIWYKFKDNKKLRSFLIETGDAVLIEAAANDRIWGIGFSEDQALANQSDWGLNILGKALMQVRKRLSTQTQQTRDLN